MKTLVYLHWRDPGAMRISFSSVYDDCGGRVLGINISGFSTENMLDIPATDFRQAMTRVCEALNNKGEVIVLGDTVFTDYVSEIWSCGNYLDLGVLAESGIYYISYLKVLRACLNFRGTDYFKCYINKIKGND